MSIQAISKLTGWDRKTIRKYMQAAGLAPEYGPRSAPPSKLDAFKPYLEQRLRAGVWNARVLLRELRERNYAGGYTILTDWLRPQRSAARVVAVRRFETAPGKQAQVDWGHLGTLEMAGQEQKLHGFTFTLGYSRRMVAEAALDQKLGTLLRLHEAAFQQIGGVPEEILYDRMKTVWLGTDERGEILWHPVLLDFAHYWGFKPRLCRPYRAQTKGKVESGVKYVRRNFLCGLQGREPNGLADLNTQLRAWVWEVANKRVHGTTHEEVFSRWEAVTVEPAADVWAAGISVPGRGTAEGGTRRLHLLARQPVLGSLAVCRPRGVGERKRCELGGAAWCRANRAARAGGAATPGDYTGGT